MKKINILKIIQFIVVAALAICSALILCFYKELFQNVMVDSGLKMVCVMLWLCLIACFVFLLLDMQFLAQLKKEYFDLNKVAYSDPISGIPNRSSCDSVINRFLGQKLPSEIGCMVICLDDLPKINDEFGHEKGDILLRDFSLILNSASLSLCFVGRNGGNNFLAVFETCTQEKIDLFLSRIQERIKEYNQSGNPVPIRYTTGYAFNEKENLPSIYQLISLATKRTTNA